jgi:hypothetical protein
MMGTAAPTPIEAIKATLPITEALERYAGAKIDGRQRRDRLQIRCPFHKDHSPSMVVYLDTGKCHCFRGGCIAAAHSNDVIDVVQMSEGISRTEAVHRLLSDLGITTGRKTQTAVKQAQVSAELDRQCRAMLKAVRRLMDEMNFACVDAFRKNDLPVEGWERSNAMNLYDRFYTRLQGAEYNLTAAETAEEEKSALAAAGRIGKEVKHIEPHF